MTTENGERLEWRGGWRPRGVTVDVATQELERIRERDGELTPEVTLAEATPEEAPLHPIFPWNDAEAAHQYRLGIARTLIRHVRVVKADGSGHSMYVGVKVQAPKAESTERPRMVYRKATEVAQNEADTANAVANLTKELSDAQRALDEFKALLADSSPQIATVAAISEALATARELARALK